MPAGRQGYTLVELLIAIAVLTVILVISAAAFYNLTKKSDLDTSRDNIISTLNTARNKTVASEGSVQYGVYFDTTSSPDKYILRSTSFDEVHDLPSSVEISNISFNGGGNEVVFKLLDGSTDNYGSVVIQSSITNETQTIYVYSSGEISTQPESFPEPGARITDSRHVHFDLEDWSIAGADKLKFDFINAVQTKEVLMDDYFTSASFDWEGEFEVNGAIQKFRIHTYQLDPITHLCIHRDRNDGKNTEEVYVYIIKNAAEKEIAHYLADTDDTVIEGLYGGTKEKQ